MVVVGGEWSGGGGWRVEGRWRVCLGRCAGCHARAGTGVDTCSRSKSEFHETCGDEKNEITCWQGAYGSPGRTWAGVDYKVAEGPCGLCVRSSCGGSVWPMCERSSSLDSTRRRFDA